MTLRLYRDAGQLATIGTPPIILPSDARWAARRSSTPAPAFARLRACSSAGRATTASRRSPTQLFDHVEDIIGVAEVPEALAGPNALLVKRGAEALGLSGGFLRRNAPGCRGSGVCAFGCPTGAKQHAAASGCPSPRRPARGCSPASRCAGCSCVAAGPSACRRAG